MAADSKELVALGQHLSDIRIAGQADPRAHDAAHGSPAYTELLIIDEADRVKTRAWSSCATTTTAARWA